jgi:hypothetical protein
MEYFCLGVGGVVLGAVVVYILIVAAFWDGMR